MRTEGLVYLYLGITGPVRDVYQTLMKWQDSGLAPPDVRRWYLALWDSEAFPEWKRRRRWLNVTVVYGMWRVVGRLIRVITCQRDSPSENGPLSLSLSVCLCFSKGFGLNAALAERVQHLNCQPIIICVPTDIWLRSDCMHVKKQKKTYETRVFLCYFQK